MNREGTSETDLEEAFSQIGRNQECELSKSQRGREPSVLTSVLRSLWTPSAKQAHGWWGHKPSGNELGKNGML